VDETRYWWSKVRGRDPREHFTKIGHSATEARRINAENAGDDRFWALKDVSFEVQTGEVIGIIGKNGAGKSTLLKILTRITEPTSGEAIINGRVGSLLEVGTGFHPELTGRENIYMNGTILGMKKHEVDAKFDEIVAFSELEKFIDTPVKRYSSGMYVRLAFAIAAHLEPEILLVDEVLAVGDAAFQRKCLGKMGDVAKEGRTILFVSHNMGAVSKLCTWAIWLHCGSIEAEGEVRNVISKYFGASAKKHNKITDIYKGNQKLNEVELMRVNLVGQNMESSNTIVRNKDFNVELDYRLKDDINNFCICIFITNREGVCIFQSCAVDRNRNNFFEKGCYESRVQIPGCLLKQGQYYIGISADMPFEKFFFYEENVLVFNVVSEIGRKYRDAEDSPGVIEPVLSWKTIRENNTSESKFEEKI